MALPSNDLVPLNAITGLLDAFDKTPLVALGERHTLQEQADFLVALLNLQEDAPDEIGQAITSWLQKLK